MKTKYQQLGCSHAEHIVNQINPIYLLFAACMDAYI
jgi:hypothetical protein